VERLGPVDFGKNVPRGTPVHSADARILGSVFHVELFEVVNTGVRLPWARAGACSKKAIAIVSRGMSR
jgi:hypothetical protein